jgi:AcrR family transcriptional regulator
VADITEAAGVSKGSFYVYFASRDELLEALNARLGDELFAVLDDVLGALLEDAASALLDGNRVDFTPARLAELLELSVSRMVHALLARRNLIEVWSREPAVIGASTQWMSRFVDRLAPWVRDDGTRVVTCSNPTTTALLVVHGIFGVVLQSIVLDEEVDVDALVTSAQELATRAFGFT